MQISEKEKCTGCALCASVCTKGAVTMGKDSEGFYVPFVNENLCIDCGKCRSLCPSGRDERPHWEMSAYYAVKNRTEEDRIFSSSGGIFKALADDILENGGCVFGAAFDGDFMGITYRSTDDVSIKELQKSKYLECQVADLYSQIEMRLNRKIPVLVCGTPCHIQGIRMKFGRHHQLYLVDFLCHGVCSSSVFAKYVRDLEKKYDSKICRIFFRDKQYGWRSSHYMRVLFENGREYKKLSVNDPYYRLYFYGLAYRKSCYACNRVRYSCADLTIGDYWGVREEDAGDGRKGVSLAGIHTEQGERLFDRIDNKVEKQTLESSEVAYAYEERKQSIPKERESTISSILDENTNFFTRKHAWGNSYVDIWKELLIKSGILSFMIKMKKRLR